MNGKLGSALIGPATGYGVVYNLEIILLFCTLIAIGPLVRFARRDQKTLGEPPLADLHLSPITREVTS